MAGESRFTDGQKAQLFVMHRATCVYTGKNLWILDGGADPNCHVDWADHVIPVAKGGLSTIENGVCSWWYFNREKRDRSQTPPFLFYMGRPTAHFRKLGRKLSQAQARDLERFANLQISDWYFNRALIQLLNGVDHLANLERDYRRDDKYYAAATLKSIFRWRRMVDREAVAALEDRELAPRKPSRDQKLMLSIREIETVEEIRSIMRKLLPMYKPR